MMATYRPASELVRAPTKQCPSIVHSPAPVIEPADSGGGLGSANDLPACPGARSACFTLDFCNIRGLRSNFNSVELYLHSSSPHLLPPSERRRLWHFNAANWNDLRRHFSEFPWDDYCFRGEFDSSECASRITDVIFEAMEGYIPYSFSSSKPSKSWFNSDCARAVRLRDDAFRDYRRLLSPESHTKYISLQNHAKTISVIPKNLLAVINVITFLAPPLPVLFGIFPKISTLTSPLLRFLHFNFLMAQLPLLPLLKQKFLFKLLLQIPPWTIPTLLLRFYRHPTFPSLKLLLLILMLFLLLPSLIPKRRMVPMAFLPWFSNLAPVSLRPVFFACFVSVSPQVLFLLVGNVLSSSLFRRRGTPLSLPTIGPLP